MPSYQWVSNPAVQNQINWLNQVAQQYRDISGGVFNPQMGGTMLSRMMGQGLPSMPGSPADLIDLSRLGDFNPATMDPNQFALDPRGPLGGLDLASIQRMIGQYNGVTPQGFGVQAPTISPIDAINRYMAGEGKVGAGTMATMSDQIKAQAAQTAQNARSALALQGSAAGYGQDQGFLAPLQGEIMRQTGSTAGNQIANLLFQNEQMGVQNVIPAFQAELQRSISGAGLSEAAAENTARNMTEASVAGASNQTAANLAKMNNLSQYAQHYGSLLMQPYLQNQNIAAQIGLANLGNTQAARQLGYSTRAQGMFQNPNIQLANAGLMNQWNLGQQGLGMQGLSLFGQMNNPAPYFQMGSNLTPYAGQMVQRQGMLGRILGAALSIGAAPFTGGASLIGLGMSGLGSLFGGGGGGWMNQYPGMSQGASIGGYH